jgi:hypothetical protein
LKDFSKNEQKTELNVLKIKENKDFSAKRQET